MSLELHLDTPLAAAIRLTGSQSAFGRLIGKRQSTVRDWLRLDKPLPAELVATVAKATGLTHEFLRPDLFDNDAQAPSPSTGVVTSGAPVVACDRSAILHREVRHG